MSVAVFKQVANPLVATVRLPVAPLASWNVTPEPEIVRLPELSLTTRIVVPTGNATEALVGTVKVAVEPPVKITCFPESVRTNVYAEAPPEVCGAVLNPTELVPSTVHDDRVPELGVPNAPPGAT